MLETTLRHLNNWFPTRRIFGGFEIVSGEIQTDFLQLNQYYRIIGSVFNDGLHQKGDGKKLVDEKFTGQVWALAIPREVIELADEIAKWREQNPETDVVSESFGGYSYTRAAGGATSAAGWQGVFGPRLNTWRRIRDD